MVCSVCIYISFPFLLSTIYWPRFTRRVLDRLLRYVYWATSTMQCIPVASTTYLSTVQYSSTGNWQCVTTYSIIRIFIPGETCEEYRVSSCTASVSGDYHRSATTLVCRVRLAISQKEKPIQYLETHKPRTTSSLVLKRNSTAHAIVLVPGTK
jgi:hypothetical protein